MQAYLRSGVMQRGCGVRARRSSAQHYCARLLDNAAICGAPRALPRWMLVSSRARGAAGGLLRCDSDTLRGNAPSAEGSPPACRGWPKGVAAGPFNEVSVTHVPKLKCVRTRGTSYSVHALCTNVQRALRVRRPFNATHALWNARLGTHPPRRSGA
jgi:hypothetical protein